MSIEVTTWAPALPVAAWAEQRRLVRALASDYGPLHEQTRKEAKALLREVMRGIGGVHMVTSGPEDMPGSAGYALEEIVGLAREVAVELGWKPEREAIPAKLRTLIYRRDGYACVLCGADDVQRLAIDHRIPVALGGSNDPSNLRTLCRPCNTAKGASL